MGKLQDNLRLLRGKRGYTKKYVSEKLGITLGGYVAIESGRVDINISRLEAIAKIFELSIIELLGENPSEDSPKNTSIEGIPNSELLVLYKQFKETNLSYIEDLRHVILVLQREVDLYRDLYLHSQGISKISGKQKSENTVHQPARATLIRSKKSSSIAISRIETRKSKAKK